MNKIIDCGSLGEKRVRDIPKGQAFRGRIGNYGSLLFLKTYEKGVCLATGETWSEDTTVSQYQPVDLEIKVIYCWAEAQKEITK